MTKAQKDTLRAVYPDLEDLVNECLTDAPILEINGTVYGPHTDAMIANQACVHLGYTKMANRILGSLKRQDKSSGKTRTRSLATSISEIPKDFKP